MRPWIVDFSHSLVEGILDLIDAFALVRPRTYLIVALVVAAVTLFAALGPHV